MTTPEPTPIRPLSFAERFWAQARGPETEDVPEPLRSVVIVRHFLAVLSQLDSSSVRKAAPALVAMLRAAELEGDLSYASPEQVRGEILDTRSVVFSLGVVLFERLTGRHPFGAENNRPRQVDRIRKGELGSGVNSFPTVAAGLRSVLVRAMSPFPEERWPDLRQIRELLQQFVQQEAPQPRLPGTHSDVEAEPPPGEQTRVVRRATEFGRELMQVVAKHDHAPPPRAPSQRVAVPTAGVGAPRERTPGRGVTLRPVPPPIPSQGSSPESVVTTIREPGKILEGQIDPHGETMQLRRDEIRRQAELDEPSVVVTPPPEPVRAAAVGREVMLPVSEPTSQLPLSPPTLGFDAALELRGTAQRRTMFIAIGSALVGALVAVALVVGLRGDPSAPAPAAASLEPSPAAPPAPAPEPAPAAVPAPAPAPAPAAPEPPPVVTIESTLAGIVEGCLDKRDHEPRVIGISILFKKDTIQKAYFGADYSLAPGERGCISRKLRGAPAPGVGASATREYRVKVNAQGVDVTQR